METILLTGATGLIGQKLISILSPIYSIVAIAYQHKSIINYPNCIFISIDITNYEQIKQVFNIFRPTIIINCAAITMVDQCEKNKEIAYQTNTVAVEYLVQQSNLYGAFLIQLSTDFIFDGQKGLYSEEDEPNPINYYGQTKLQAEQIILSLSTYYAIIRTVLVYGYNKGVNRSNIIVWTRNNLIQQKPIRVVNDQWRTPTLAEDVAKGCELIIKNKISGIWNIAGKDYLSPYQMALQTANYFQLNQSLISPTNAKEFVEIGTRPLKTGLIITKSQTLLAYQPHSFMEGLSILAKQLSEKN